MNRAKLNLLACPALGIYVAGNNQHTLPLVQPTYRNCGVYHSRVG